MKNLERIDENLIRLRVLLEAPIELLEPERKEKTAHGGGGFPPAAGGEDEGRGEPEWEKLGRVLQKEIADPANKAELAMNGLSKGRPEWFPLRDQGFQFAHRISNPRKYRSTANDLRTSADKKIKLKRAKSGALDKPVLASIKVPMKSGNEIHLDFELCRGERGFALMEMVRVVSPKTYLGKLTNAFLFTKKTRWLKDPEISGSVSGANDWKGGKK